VSDATIEGWEAARLRMVVMLGAYSAELADDDDDGAELFRWPLGNWGLFSFGPPT
jgi:hypothetical protein